LEIAVKEEVYLHAYDTVSDSRNGIGKYFDLYGPTALWDERRQIVYIFLSSR